MTPFEQKTPTPRTTAKIQEIGRSGVDWHASARLMSELCKELETSLAAQTTEVERLKKAAGFCAEHQPNGGARNCLVCGCIRLSSALDQIDYLCGEPNEMEVSGYTVHQNEQAVVDAVRSLRASITAKDEALRLALRQWRGYAEEQRGGESMEYASDTEAMLYAKSEAALSPSAGSELLERVKTLEEKLETHRVVFEETRDEAVRLRDERDRLGRALEERGHRDWCPASKEPNTCTCGLDAALAEWREGKTLSPVDGKE